VELPEKQGLKLIKKLYENLMKLVAVELPEKQGLKQRAVLQNAASIVSCSGTSRKTRIETLLDLLVCFRKLCCSGTSRKTRIETEVFD